MNHHSIQALVGTEALTHKRETLKASRNNFLVEEVDYRYLDAGEASKDNAENEYEYALFSLFTRINYQYQDNIISVLFSEETDLPVSDKITGMVIFRA
ncbi:MAG: hypothetical protein LIP05_02390 [Tannerellaceae bacterium]|nr:hypothetical protein [Tannerellaceae bacterium]